MPRRKKKHRKELHGGAKWHRQEQARKKKKRSLRNKGYGKLTNCLAKVRFETEEKAQEAGIRYGMRVYSCTYCNGFHLTKQREK